MFASSTSTVAAAPRRHFILPNGTGVWKTDYICVDHRRVPSPQAYLIEQDPNQPVQSHFHEQAEFQLITDGEGFLGRNPVRPLTVHYANAFTGYGPISAGPNGISYITMRPMRDNGALFLPEDRDKLKRAPKKFFHSEPLSPCSEDERRGLRDARITTLACHEDGMAAWLVACGPNGTALAPAPTSGGGQYLLLLDGSAILNDVPIEKMRCAFASTDEAPVTIKAGAAGAEIMVLQFPRAAYTITYSPAAYKYAAQEAANSG